MSEDTISRKAAIDAMEDVDWYHINSNGQLVHGANSKEDEPLYKAEDVYKLLNDVPSAQPTEASCWGCNCQKMERLKEQKTFSEMVHLHDAETHEERTETHACDLIERQAAIDALTRKMVSIPTAGEKDLMGDVNRIRAEDISVIRRLPSAQPETHDKCTKTHSCDLISRQALCEYALNQKDKSVTPNDIMRFPSAQPDLDDVYAHAETEAEARYHAQQRWIPCSERLPEERQEILATTTDNAWGDVVIIRTYYKEMHKSVIAWMPLPKPYRAERRTDEGD